VAIKSDRAYRREYHAILKACSDFGFSDTEDVPLSAIVRAAFIQMKHEIERRADTEGDRPPTQRAIETMHDCINCSEEGAKQWANPHVGPFCDDCYRWLRADTEGDRPHQGASMTEPWAGDPRIKELEWVLHRAEEIIRDEYGKNAAYAFVEAWGQLPKELQTPIKPIVADTEGDRPTTTKRERYLARRQSPPELTAALVNARLEVNDWHECSTAEELARWREAQQRLIDAAEAVGQASVHASRELMADTEGDASPAPPGFLKVEINYGGRRHLVIEHADMGHEPAIVEKIYDAAMSFIDDADTRRLALPDPPMQP
jgi:hypothetical protein